jgi:adenylate kinase
MLNRAKTSGRSDDADENVLRNRQAVYRRDTLPVAEHYRKADKVEEVNGLGTIDEIFERLTKVIDKKKGI